MRRRLSLVVAMLLSSLLSVSQLPAAAGDPDPSFNPPLGSVVIDPLLLFGDRRLSINAATTQLDGKTVVLVEEANNITLLRYNLDGTPDAGFGDGQGLVRHELADGIPLALAAQDDGKLVIGGARCVYVGVGENPWDCDAFLMRLDPDGSLDGTFSGGLIFREEEGNTLGNGLAVQTDGKILLAGTRQPPSSYKRSFLIRYNPDGTVDETFNADGQISLTQPSFLEQVMVLPDGRIVVSGTEMNEFTGTSLPGNRLFLARFAATGSLDTTFGEGGLSFSPVVSMNSLLARQADGKFILGGNELVIGPDGWTTCPKPFVARFQADGKPDSRFGSGGVAGILGVAKLGPLHALTVQPDGKILAAGVEWIDVDTAFGPAFVARLTSAGRKDRRFGTQGISWQEGPFVGSYYTSPRPHLGLGLQPDGKAVLAGVYVSGMGSGNEYLLGRVWRLLGDSVSPRSKR